MAAITETSRSSPSESSDAEKQERRSGWLRNSKLAMVCFGIFIALLFAQSLTGWREHNNDSRQHHEATIGYGQYLTTGHFYETTFENWESEFLQMAAYVVLTVFLVQKGSVESKKFGQDDVDDPPEAHRADPDAPCPSGRVASG